MVANRFEFVILGSKRARQLFKGAKRIFETDNREIVTALRQIATGKVHQPKESTSDALLWFYPTAERCLNFCRDICLTNLVDLAKFAILRSYGFNVEHSKFSTILAQT